MSYNKDKCIARVWKNGTLNQETQNQCTRKRVNGEFCKCHFEKGGMSWPFGVVTEPIPSKIIYNGQEKKFKTEKETGKQPKKKVADKPKKKVADKPKKKSLTDLVPESSDEEDEEIVIDYDYIDINGVEYYLHKKELKVYEADSSGKYYRFLTELGYWDKSLGSVQWNNEEIEENEKNRGRVK